METLFIQSTWFDYYSVIFSVVSIMLAVDVTLSSTASVCCPPAVTFRNYIAVTHHANNPCWRNANEMFTSSLYLKCINGSCLNYSFTFLDIMFRCLPELAT